MRLHWRQIKRDAFSCRRKRLWRSVQTCKPICYHGEFCSSAICRELTALACDLASRNFLPSLTADHKLLSKLLLSSLNCYVLLNNRFVATQSKKRFATEVRRLRAQLNAASALQDQQSKVHQQPSTSGGSNSPVVTSSTAGNSRMPGKSSGSKVITTADSNGTNSPSSNRDNCDN